MLSLNCLPSLLPKCSCNLSQGSLVGRILFLRLDCTRTVRMPGNRNYTESFTWPLFPMKFSAQTVLRYQVHCFQLFDERWALQRTVWSQGPIQCCFLGVGNLQGIPRWELGRWLLPHLLSNLSLLTLSYGLWGQRFWLSIQLHSNLYGLMPLDLSKSSISGDSLRDNRL